jgi:hypothetical protein
MIFASNELYIKEQGRIRLIRSMDDISKFFSPKAKFHAVRHVIQLPQVNTLNMRDKNDND